MILDAASTLRVANEVTGLFYTTILVVVLIFSGIAALVKLHLNLKANTHKIRELKVDMDKRLADTNEGVSDMCTKIEAQIDATNQRITNQLQECGMHRSQTIQTAQLVKDFKMEMVEQVKRIHQRIDLIMSTQQDMMIGLATGQFQEALTKITKRRDDAERRERSEINERIERKFREQEESQHGL